SGGVTVDNSAAEMHTTIYSISESPKDKNVIWAGTDDGLVWRTADGGKHWRDITPPGVGPWAKISIIDASPFDAASAYVAVNRFRLDEQRPRLFRTHDGGASWTEIDRGIEAAPTNVVRADPQRRGMLYAGTERGVWVSFDDGGTWSSLRLNLPATSVRDLVVHGDDLAIGTHGRGFWILDDIAPLRQADTIASARPALFAPARAWRVARSTNTDTPLPPDEPFFANPPHGAILDYVLPQAASRVALTIADRTGRVVRRFASDDAPPQVDVNALDVPAWWIAPPVRLDASAGAHRFVWNLQAPAPRTFRPGPTIAAIPHDTPLEPEGPTVPPGTYVVTLDAGGTKQTRALAVQQDPRVNVAAGDLTAQYSVALLIASRMNVAYDTAQRVRARDPKLASKLERINGQLGQTLGSVENGDGAPTATQRNVFFKQRTALNVLLEQTGPAPKGAP
nr:glycoside hydrolase [Candidatus Eremiobacteraeota bacterium]